MECAVGLRLVGWVYVLAQTTYLALLAHGCDMYFMLTHIMSVRMRISIRGDVSLKWVGACSTIQNLFWCD